MHYYSRIGAENFTGSCSWILCIFVLWIWLFVYLCLSRELRIFFFLKLFSERSLYEVGIQTSPLQETKNPQKYAVGRTQRNSYIKKKNQTKRKICNLKCNFLLYKSSQKNIMKSFLMYFLFQEKLKIKFYYHYTLCF